MQSIIAIVAAYAIVAFASPLEGIQLRATSTVSGPPSASAGAANVVKDMKLAGQDLASLSSAVSASGSNSSPYTFKQLVAIINYNQAVQYDVNNGSAAANASKTFNSADSCSVASARDALMPTVSATMSNFANHYDAMNKTGVAGVTLDNLKQARENARQLVNAANAKASGTCTANAAKASATMMSYFDKTIKVYMQ